MIYDSLNEFGRYAALAPQVWEKVETFLAGCSEDTPDGRYELDGKRLFASVQRYQTRPVNLEKLEIHREYIDIQLLLSGEEEILVRPVIGLDVTEAYDANRDIAFYRMPAGETDAVSLRLVPGRFAVFFPEQGHMPGIAPAGNCAPVIKIVIKIAVNAMN